MAQLLNNLSIRSMRMNKFIQYPRWMSVISNKKINSNGILSIQPDHSKQGIHIIYKDHEKSYFPYVWLRDNCMNKESKTSNKQRLFETHKLPLDWSSKKVICKTDGKKLYVDWPHNLGKSEFDGSWLREHSMSKKHRKIRAESKKFDAYLWDTKNLNKYSFDYDDILTCENSYYQFLSFFSHNGYGLIRNVPTKSKQILEVASYLGRIRQTNYGDYFEVYNEPNAKNLANTSLALSVHSDNPYRNPVPGVQLLHCLMNAPNGEGSSILVDGFAAANRLKETYPQAFHLLSTYRREYEYKDSDRYYLRAYQKVIEVGPDDEIIAIHYNNRSASVLDVPEDVVESYYEALHHFASILQSEEFKIEFNLEPGDLLVMNNYRTLHGRGSFSSNHYRHLQGCYIDIDSIQSKHRVLRNKLSNKFQTHPISGLTIEETVDEIIQILKAAESDNYGEGVNMLHHALQAAEEARKAGATRDVILASMLHDIGSCTDAYDAVFHTGNGTTSFMESSLGVIGIANHEIVGEKYLLSRGFSSEVARLAKGHVDAKRYLVSTVENYFQNLSEASVHTLEIQGGPMSTSEVYDFENDPLYSEMLNLREWDDLAKKNDAKVPELESFRSMIYDHLLEERIRAL